MNERKVLFLNAKKRENYMLEYNFLIITRIAS